MAAASVSLAFSTLVESSLAVGAGPVALDTSAHGGSGAAARGPSTGTTFGATMSHGERRRPADIEFDAATTPQ